MLRIACPSPHATEILAGQLADILPPKTIILLSGDLGVGKTVFSRAFLRARAENPALNVTSPTFNLVATYETKRGLAWHYDLYRVKQSNELDELALDEATATGESILIEWPDRLGPVKLRTRHVVQIELQEVKGSPNMRHVNIDFGATMTVPKTAFIFAAGMGNRMRPLTDATPKPLVRVDNRPVLDFVFENLADVGVEHVILNTHHLADQISRYVEGWRDRFRIDISHEPELLETGGGLKRALPLIGEETFFAINGDSPLIDAPGLPVLARLAAAFDPQAMDIMLLLQANDARMITPWVGDYDMAPDGKLTRSLNQTGTHMFAGARILHRRCVESGPDGRYSFRDNMDAAQAQGRLYGLKHLGEWHHLTTPQDVEIVSGHLAQRDRRTDENPLAAQGG